MPENLKKLIVIGLVGPKSGAVKMTMRGLTFWHWGTACGGLLFLTFFQWLQPGGFLFDDNTLYFLPCYTFDYAALRHGVIPQLNVYQYLGQSWLSAAQEGAFYPPIYLAILISHLSHHLQLAIDWLCWIHLIGAALVVQRFALIWGSRPAWAMMTGWLYLTLPFICCSPQLWVVNAYSGFYIPLSLLLLEQVIGKMGMTRMLALGAAKALFILSGHINYFALSLLFEGAYLFLRICDAKKIIRIGFLWLTANGLAAFAALPSLGPVLMHMRTAAHASISLSLAQILDLHVDPVIFIIAQFGHWMSFGYGYQPAWMFLGGSVFVPALLLKGRRKRRVLLFLGMTLLALIFCTPAFIFIHYLPGYGSFRWPGKILLFVALFYVMLFSMLVRHMPALFPRYMGTALFALAIGCNLLVDFSPHAQAVTWLFHRYSPDFHLPIPHLQDGRSISLSETSDHRYNPDFLNCNYASMAGVPVVGGYDVLIEDQNRREALNMFFGNYEGRLDDATLHHFRDWSVRHYFVGTDSTAARDLVTRANFSEVARIGEVTIFDDKKAPGFAFFEDAPDIALPVTYHPDGIIVETGIGRSGTLSVSLVPLNGYSWKEAAVTNATPHSVEPSGRGRLRIEASISTTGHIAITYHEPWLNLFLLISFFVWASGIILYSLASSSSDN